MSPALVGGFLTTEPPGKPLCSVSEGDWCLASDQQRRWSSVGNPPKAQGKKRGGHLPLPKLGLPCSPPLTPLVTHKHTLTCTLSASLLMSP